MTPPEASILINNYNYGRFVGGAIESALAQRDATTEVIVVDDGSTDDSRAVLASFGSSIRCVLKPNGGQGSAFNAGFREATGQIVGFLDADDRFAPTKMARMIELFDRHPKAAWVFHRLEKRDAANDALVGMSRQTGTGARDFRRWMRLGWAPFHSPSTSGLVFRRSLLERILPMPEGEGVAVSDNYLKDVAISLAPGYFMDEVLATVLLHGANASEKKLRDPGVQAHKTIVTAWHVRENHPSLGLFSDRMFAKGYQIYLRSGQRDERTEAAIRAYLSGRGPVAGWLLGLAARVAPFRAIR